MSRAFVKELDDVLPDVPLHRATATEMTPRGVARLREQLATAAGERERLALEERIASAVVVPPPADRTRAALGAMVTVDGVGQGPRAFRLVGEDEVDVEAGDIGVRSPLGQALLGSAAGTVVVWQRPAGPAELAVRSIEYDA